MSEETKFLNAEISDEQLEEVSGGIFDNNNCTAMLQATVQVGV